jgi:hypothetical protein
LLSEFSCLQLNLLVFIFESHSPLQFALDFSDSSSSAMPLEVRAHGHTKIIVFKERPTWDELARRVSELYGITLDEVELHAPNRDGDTICYTSQKDLESFYNYSYDPSKPNKFFVPNLNNPDSEH